MRLIRVRVGLACAGFAIATSGGCVARHEANGVVTYAYSPWIFWTTLAGCLIAAAVLGVIAYFAAQALNYRTAVRAAFVAVVAFVVPFVTSADQENQSLMIANGKVTSLDIFYQRCTIDLEHVSRIEVRPLEVPGPRGFTATSQLEFIGKAGEIQGKLFVTAPVRAGYFEILKTAEQRGVVIARNQFEIKP